MNLEYYIAKRIASEKNAGKEETKPAVRIAIGGIAIGLIVMLLAVAIVIGFKSEVRNKLIGFGSHIQISVAVDKDSAVEPLTIDSAMMARLESGKAICHTQATATQPGIIKTDDNFHGIVLKGVSNDFNWDFFKQYLKEGKIPAISKDSVCKEVLVSKKVMELMKLRVGDKIRTYFIIDGKVRVRPLTISGVYSTGFSDYDKLVIISDIKHIQKLNGWEQNQCGTIEVLTDAPEKIDEANDEVFSVIGNKVDVQSQKSLRSRTIREMNPQIFSWLDMLDMNVVIILALMMLVSGFTIISGLLILILGRTNMIGILKTLGAQNWSIRKIFIYQTLFLVGKGMLIGNIVGLTLCLLQKQFGLIGLDAENYYVDTVPISLSFTNWLLINIGVFATSALMLVGPTYIITKISPAETIRFE
ncbi:MAG: ABC transporter permease [Paludibacteraceae bacterium]|nr:ABC transporter permease [Paludibacteraceae bacterium]MBR6043076.1 ABC transporter permease [Paludibacteraceae bacterium]